jgi:O-antigen/teichoic acid export membrane protein
MKFAIGTILTRVLLLLSALTIVLLNTHYLGAEGQGTASLIGLGILLVQAMSNFIGGGAMVFLVPRMREGQAFWPGLLWALISAAIWYLLFHILPVVPGDYVIHACVLGFVQSVYVMLQQVTLARERMREYNIIVSIQAALVACSLLLFFQVFGWLDIHAYITALYVSFGSSVICYAWSNRAWIGSAEKTGWSYTWSQLFRLGKFAQGGNILHLLNQRLNFVFLENLRANGRMATGIFSIALYIAEAIWTVSKSLSIIQYSRISNSVNEQEQIRLTMKYLGISMGSVIGCCAVILCIPQGLFTFFFTEDAAELKSALIWLMPGILANGASIIYAHYFSGKGHHRENMIASALGLLLSATLAWILIPSLGIRGAAISTSAAFMVQCGWFVIRFHLIKPRFSPVQ